MKRFLGAVAVSFCYTGLQAIAAIIFSSLSYVLCFVFFSCLGRPGLIEALIALIAALTGLILLAEKRREEIRWKDLFFGLIFIALFLLPLILPEVKAVKMIIFSGILFLIFFCLADRANITKKPIPSP